MFWHIYKDDTLINTLVNKYNNNISDKKLKLNVRSQRRWIIEFPYKIIYNYIKKQVDSICQIICNMIKNSDEEINSMIFVGGYSSNEILISEIKNKLSKKISFFLKPSKPCLSIMEGAVLFGLNPNKIIQRKARYTIGIKTNANWNEELHSKNGKKYYSKADNTWRCENCFGIFIKVNESIQIGQEIIKKFLFNNPKSCIIYFYKTLKSNPIFVYEEGIEEIGQMELDAGKDYPPKERDFIVTRRSGGTFIDVKAKHLKSGTTIKIQFDFN